MKERPSKFSKGEVETKRQQGSITHPHSNESEKDETWRTMKIRLPKTETVSDSHIIDNREVYREEKVKETSEDPEDKLHQTLERCITDTESYR